MLLSKMTAKQAESRIGKCAARCCLCCLCLFEKCLRYFNSTSYAMIAITGQVRKNIYIIN